MSVRDPVKKAAYLRDWRAKNPDKTTAYRAKARATPGHLERQRQYAREHPKPRNDATRAIERAWRHRNPTTVLLGNARRRAKSLDLEFNLEREDLVLVDTCPITGLELSYTNGKLQDNSATVDRVDTTKGYVKGNIRVISNRANWRKSDFTLEEIERLYRYSRGEL